MKTPEKTKQQAQQESLDYRAKQFRLQVQTATERTGVWGDPCSAYIEYTTNGSQLSAFSFTRAEVVQLHAALGRWLNTGKPQVVVTKEDKP